MSENHLDTFGSRLAYARKAKKLNQQDVADHAGIARGTVAQWEKKDKPNIEAVPLHLTCEILGVNSQWLLFNVGDMSPPTKTGDEKVVSTIDEIPIIQWLEIPSFLDDPTNDSFKDRDTLKSFYKSSDRSFAFKLPFDAGAVYREGDYLCADANAPIKNGSTVIAKKRQSPDLVIGELVKASSRLMMIPLDPSQSSYPVQNSDILASITYKPVMTWE